MPPLAQRPPTRLLSVYSRHAVCSRLVNLAVNGGTSQKKNKTKKNCFLASLESFDLTRAVSQRGVSSQLVVLFAVFALRSVLVCFFYFFFTTSPAHLCISISPSQPRKERLCLFNRDTAILPFMTILNKKKRMRKKKQTTAQLNCALPGVDTLVRAWTWVRTHIEGHSVAHESGHRERGAASAGLREL